MTCTVSSSLHAVTVIIVCRGMVPHRPHAVPDHFAVDACIGIAIATFIPGAACAGANTGIAIRGRQGHGRRNQSSNQSY